MQSFYKTMLQNSNWVFMELNGEKGTGSKIIKNRRTSFMNVPYWGMWNMVTLVINCEISNRDAKLNTVASALEFAIDRIFYPHSTFKFLLLNISN